MVGVNMDYRQLMFFVEVAKRRNFTKAAEELNIVQPAVSIAIKKLEEELNVKLFNRQDKKISLTSEGVVLLNHAENILSQFSSAKLEMEEMIGLTRGEVRIGVPIMVGSYYFPDIIIEFKEKYPSLNFSIHETGAKEIANMISQGEIDMGIIADYHVPDNFETRSLLHHEMVICKHRKHIVEVSEKKGIKLNVTFETNLLPLIKSLVRKGLGITAFLSMGVSEDSDLVGLSFDPPMNIHLVVAWKKNSYLSQANQAFLQFLIERSNNG
jgi:DNA-binding transcriptional LysR family regulator